MDNSEIIRRANEYIELENDDYFKDQVKSLLIENNIEELRDRFFTDLKFGTGGLRGVIGGGFNRMNSFTVQRATQGLATYIAKSSNSGEASAVIAYDSRNFSDVFAMDAARVFCGNGIKTYLFKALRPTPELSFAIRHLKATTGLVITASHNPAEYNGYKAYWNDGCQVLPPHDNAIVKEASKVTDIKSMDSKEAMEKGLLVMIDKEVDEPYIAMVKSLSVRPELIRENGKDLKIVFTPLHGTGSTMVPQVLWELGITPVVVEEQMVPDGNFPTITSPNPEESSALKMALELAQKIEADLVLATDPDADRLGIAVPGDNGYVLITGNQLGTLLAEYIFSGKKANNSLPAKPVLIKTIVTTELQRKVADDNNAITFDVLTGFKFIGEKIREFENSDEGYEYIFGGEESYGYLTGTAVRDKDAVSAALLTAEMTLYYKSKGLSILDQLDIIYKKHGYYQELLINKVFKGESGIKTMTDMMESFRQNPMVTFAGKSVIKIKDYLDGTVLNPKTGQKKKSITLPSSNVLQFILEDESIVSVRPSGTEPKIKFYASCCEKPEMDLAEAKISVQKKIEAISEQVNTFIPG